MALGRSLSASTEPSAAAGALPAPSPTPHPSALLVRDGDTRLLLRGLLRLQHYPVIFEAERPEDFDRLPDTPGSVVLVIDQGTGGDGWEEDVRTALARRPELRPVLLTPDRSPELASRAATAGVRAVVVRPFPLKEFSEALRVAASA